MNFKKFLAANRQQGLRVLLIRTDRIGDVVLSSAAAELLKRHFPTFRISFLVRDYTKAVLTNNPFIDEIIATDGLTFKELAERIKDNDIGVAMYASKTAVYAPLFAKIRFRAGPLSKLRSLFLNIRVIQNRSRSVKNEGEYNLELLGKVFNIPTGEKIYPKIYLSEAERDEAAAYILKNHGIKNGDDFLIIHPGSGGSSKDYPKGNFFKLAKNLAQNGTKVIISGSAEEIAAYKKEYAEIGENLFSDALPLRKFLALISFAK
ncbi:MAG: hypothetical protein LBD73_06815, partial [Deferribacteraceae bacterium]|nr:hypothetical protein [Deferribacteraceae bacterium]